MSHARDFGRESGREEIARQVIYDYREAGLEPAETALCDFAVKLTLHPARMEASDLDLLRVHGFTDQQITVATQVVGYFNYINRVADGLGVDAEPWMDLTYDQWQEKKATFR